MKWLIKFSIIIVTMLISNLPCHAAERVPPAELKLLLSSAEELYDFRAADLNGDGFTDYIFIVNRPPAKDDDDCIEGSNRVLKIAVRSPDKSLKIIKSNKNIILCAEAGGIFGDPYYGIEAGKKWFNVSHAGGGNTRWFTHFLFKYSRIDKTWQLVRAVEGHKAADEAPIENVYKPPKDFGKIDIADFDPEYFKGLGQ